MVAVIPRISGIILAGGKSRRMGRDKAFLDFEGKPLIAHVLDCISPVCSDVSIVASDVNTFTPFADSYGRFINSSEPYRLRVVGDVIPDKGSLGGLYSGLLAAREDYALAVACDMPFLNQDVLRYLISLALDYDVVIPRAHDPSGRVPRVKDRNKPSAKVRLPLAKEKDLHPMHAVYGKRCLPIIKERLLNGDLRLIGFLPDVRTRIVESDEIDRFDPKHLSFFNANTPEDFQFAQSLAHDQ